MAFTDVGQLNGFYKEIHGELNDLVPDYGWLIKEVGWRQGNKVGKQFEEPVVLSHEHGYTYGGTAGDAYDLEEASPLITQEAQILPYSSIMRAAMSFDAASRGANETVAFKKATTFLISRVMEATAKRIEVSMHYGQSTRGVGKVAIDGFVDLGGAGLTCTLTFAAGEWASGIWQGAEGASIQVYDEGDALEEASASSRLTITKVADATRTLTCTATAALIDQIETKNDTEVLTVYFYGARSNDMQGIDLLFSNTTGTIHNIDASTYGVWAGNTFDVAGQLTKAYVKKVIARLCSRGLTDTEVVLEVSPFTWADLEAEDDALRIYDSSYKSGKAESGFKQLMYMSQNGMVRIVANPIVKASEAFLFPPKQLKRIGSADRDWKIPGQESEPFQKVPGKAGFEFLVHSDSALYVRAPAQCARLFGIVNTGS